MYASLFDLYAVLDALLFQTVGQVFIQPRRFWQRVVFIVMTLRISQQGIRRLHQFI